MNIIEIIVTLTVKAVEMMTILTEKIVETMTTLREKVVEIMMIALKGPAWNLVVSFRYNFFHF